MLTPVERSERGVRMIDQRELPRAEVWLELESPEEVVEAIRSMVVRGAPAIGVAAAFGMALAATQAAEACGVDLDRRLEQVGRALEQARPTAVNLRWAVERMRAELVASRQAGADDAAVAARLEHVARELHAEDVAACIALGRHGAALVPAAATVLTHCNAGALATAGYGTALGVVRSAIEQGKRVRVLVDETRPFLQGARLTAWELMRDGIDTTLITDNSAGALMAAREVDLVVVGADRVAANGDTANKIGTYTVAVLARENGVPFYVAAPTSTIDLDCPDGASIPIEERDPREVTELWGVRVAPAGVRVRNPAFDVTPAHYIAAIVTERGIARAPYLDSLRALVTERR
jgi:methylthioribose-1-phosphate isomerase